MTKAHGEVVLRGVREDTRTSCGTPRAELVHARFTPDADIRRCSACGDAPLEIRVSAPPSEITHPGTGQPTGLAGWPRRALCHLTTAVHAARRTAQLAG